MKIQDKIPKQKANYYLEVLDNEILLYHPSHVTIFYFNPTTALIWQLCDGKRTGTEIIMLLIEAYPEAAQQLSSETENALITFERSGIIEFV